MKLRQDATIAELEAEIKELETSTKLRLNTMRAFVRAKQAEQDAALEQPETTGEKTA